MELAFFCLQTLVQILRIQLYVPEQRFSTKLDRCFSNDPPLDNVYTQKSLTMNLWRIWRHWLLTHPGGSWENSYTYVGKFVGFTCLLEWYRKGFMLDRWCHQVRFRNSRTWKKGLGFHIIYFAQFWVLTHSYHDIVSHYVTKLIISLFKMIKIDSTNHTTHGDLRGPTSFEHHRKTQVIYCAKIYSSAAFIIAQNKLMMFIIIRIGFAY